MARIRYLVLFGLCLMLAFGIQTACKKGEEIAEVEGMEEEATLTTEEGLIGFEGVVKVAVGKYLFIPKVRGFDVVIQGALDVGETQALIDNEIRGKGAFSPEHPSILVADEIEIKEAEDVWRVIFTRSEEFTQDDYIDLKARDGYEILANLSYDKKDGWEGKEKAKVYGQLLKKTETEGGEASYTIALLDDKNKEIGKIVVDNITDYAQYYMSKLRLFDRFWFYIAVKETVDWQSRRRTCPDLADIPASFPVLHPP